ncbi:S66 peptidase family protein [Reichenbachiella versicolor]|uniref:S66 peptidase family protein n=1 Tax=Reichenbachiella versicolor TaxID=1821036 RepID=UPI000D6DE367|nr:LD-carboxypeptidase [Reichenbachiella versicolor]
MKRRSFISKTILASAGASFYIGNANATKISDQPLIKPAKLKKGAQVGMITPASPMSKNLFDKALKNLDNLGYQVKLSSNLNIKNGFLAGSDQQRIEDIHSMFEDPDIDGIICGRGGYGTGRLLESLNYDLIKSNPKVFCGFSDVTALHYAIQNKTGLVTFHGPVASSDFSSFTKDSFESIVRKGKKSFKVSRPKSWDRLQSTEYTYHTITSGFGLGPLVGGNLSLMCSLVGTPYDIDFSGKVVFIEEIGEDTYRIDRMITQLLNAKKFDNAAGIVLGVFSGCEIKSKDPSYLEHATLKAVLFDRFSKLGIPVIYGLPIGHIADNVTLPMGIEASIDTDKQELKILDSAVI